jgi:hypothetical protein
MISKGVGDGLRVLFLDSWTTSIGRVPGKGPGQVARFELAG